jgi:hypothetical protein
MRDHFAAVLFRQYGNEVMRYRYSRQEVKTVVVRGFDVFPPLDD